MKKVRMVIKIPTATGKDQRITIRLDTELSQLVEKEPNVSEVIRIALKDYYAKHGPKLTAASYWTVAENEIYEECTGYFQTFVLVFGVGLNIQSLPKVFPDPPPERLLPFIRNQITAGKQDNRLLQLFENDNEMWLEFYAKARAFYFYETEVPFNLLPEKHKEEYTKYILKH